MENPKGVATLAILVLAILYVVSLIARRKTRYQGSCSEAFLVGTILFLAFAMVPAFLGAVLASRR